MIYKICSQDLWHLAQVKGHFDGSAVDLRDGFIHFSTGMQVQETAAKHFSGQDDLVLIAVDEISLAKELRYEVSRGGNKFPHLYGPLPLSAVIWVKPLPRAADGCHIFPEGL